MTTIRGLLTYNPIRNVSRVAPVSDVTDFTDRPPRRDLPSRSVLPSEPHHTSGMLVSAAVAVDLANQPRRRGLRSDMSERQRYHNAYARPAHTAKSAPEWERCA